LRWLAELGITGTVAATAAYGAFKFFGKKWIDARFAERLEKFRHDQNQEIERLRYRINALMDRTAKLHQNEFEVLPEIWNKLSITLADTLSLTSPLQSYADLSNMGAAEFSEFLGNSALAEWEKDTLRQATKDRNQSYQKMIVWHQLFRVKNSYREFHNYFVSKGIFIQLELKDKIRILSDLIYAAILEREHEERYPDPREGRYAKGDLLRSEGPGQLQAIEKDVQARLWEANKLD
jgi:hypothetical protein